MFLATGNYRYRALRQGAKGWDAWALQAALHITKDGDFGPLTDKAVRSFQTKHKLESDGIAGVLTQREAAYQLIWPPQKEWQTPPGLMRGIVEGESAFILGNHTSVYPNGTRDVGLAMFNVAPTDASLSFAFDGTLAVPETTKRLRGQHDYYLPRAGVNDDHRLAWRYAILRHNWPAAANRFADGTISTWTYTSRGVRYQMDQPAPWVKDIGVAGVETGYDWAEHYISSKVVFSKDFR